MTIIFLLFLFLFPTDISNEPNMPIMSIEYEKEVKQTQIEVIKERKVVMEVTAYTAGYESTKKTASHPEYKITASGTKVRPHHTVAASRDIPFGTRLRIPEYEKFMGLGETILTVEDRGGAITKGKLDIYMEDVDTALKWGRRKVEVIFIDSY